MHFQPHKCTLTKLSASILLALSFSHSYAQNSSDTNISETATTEVSIQLNSKDDKTDIEVIEVIGHKPNPISSNAQGSYGINRKMIEDYRFGNGNLNDVLGIIPGVQYSEDSFSAEQISNIKPAEVSISGAQGYQSGYLIDGVSNNSRLSTGNAIADQNLLQDVSGHSQASFINVDLLESIEVYDSNIPAKYGQFSGGLVEANTRKAGGKPSWSLSYRQTSDGFVTYNPVYSANADGSTEILLPDFEKRDFSATFSTPIDNNSGIIAQIQVLDSAETKLQLGQLKPSTQTNYNALLKYHQDIDYSNEIILTAVYAPYESSNFDTYAFNSDFITKGGASSAKVEWQYISKIVDINSNLSWHQSINNKDTSAYRFSWLNTKGKDWGTINGSLNSPEGGYGSIDKTQTRITLNQDFAFNEMLWGEISALSSLGFTVNYQESDFNRLENTILYNGAVLNTNVNCGGYTLDCVHTTLALPIDELEAKLGRPLDYNNLDDVILYQNNVLQTGQYFQQRQITPEAQVSVALSSIALYGEQNIDWKNINATLGLRYDYNNFFKQHNIAPRFRAKYDLFEDGQSVVVFGLNRYYEADLITHKLNEAIGPSYREVRRAYNNQPLQWEREIASSGYRTVYQETQTPFSDELSLAYRQSLFGGTLEAKWLARKNQKQISRTQGVNDIGEDTLYAENNGSSHYQRYTLSWMANYDHQHLEFNLSYAENTTDKASFDGDISTEVSTDDGIYYRLSTDYNDSELVALQYESLNDPTRPYSDSRNFTLLMTTSDLTLSQQDFNRPVIANISWGGEWDNWRLSAHARYSSKQDVIYATGGVYSIKDVSSVCTGCVTTEKEYPLYIKGERSAYWLLSGSVKYQWQVTKEHHITLSFDGENLLNSRTYQIGKFASGTELGRRFWLGIKYQH